MSVHIEQLLLPHVPRITHYLVSPVQKYFVLIPAVVLLCMFLFRK